MSKITQIVLCPYCRGDNEFVPLKSGLHGYTNFNIVVCVKCKKKFIAHPIFMGAKLEG